MPNTKTANTALLNDLIRINNDRIEEYQTAKRQWQDMDEDTIDLFSEMIGQSRHFVAGLKAELAKNTEAGAININSAGNVYRNWMDINKSIASNEWQNVMNAFELRETAAQKAYEAALCYGDITEEMRSVIQLQKSELWDSYFLIKKFRDRKVLSKTA